MSIEIGIEKTVDINASEDSDNEITEVRVKNLKKRKTKEDNWSKLGYKKPFYAKDREQERHLAAIATKGVTQLFNAVAERQKLVDQKLEEMETTKNRSRRHELLTDLKSNDFHSQLYRQNKPKTDDEKVKEEVKEEPAEDTADDDIVEI